VAGANPDSSLIGRFFVVRFESPISLFRFKSEINSGTCSNSGFKRNFW
jgi:hypothetical protein